MKKFLAMLLLVAMLASCTIALAEYVKFTGSCYVHKTAGGPKTKTIIKRGSVAEKIKTSPKGKWTQVKYGSKEGWVRSKYVTKSDKTAADVKYSGGGSGQSKKDGTEKAETGDLKTTGKVNLRSEPSLSGAKLKTIPSGTKLTKKASQDDDRKVTWYKVSYKGTEGWVSSVFCK